MARDFRDAGVPLLRLAGLKRDASLLTGCNYLDPSTVERRWKQFRVERGDVLLSTSASLGEVAVVDDTAIGSIPYTGIIRFRPRDPRVLQEFVEYALISPSFREQIEAMGIGSVMRHFGPSHLRQMTIEIPPHGEQRVIAYVLRTVERAMQQTEKIVESVKQLKSALMEYLFRFGCFAPETTDAVALAESPIGVVPATWSVVSLREVVAPPEGVNPRAQADSEFRYVDVSSVSSESLQILHPKSLTGAEAPSRARKRIRAGDTIFATVRPTLKRIAQVPNELDGEVCSTAFCVLRPDLTRVDPIYLFHAVCHPRLVDSVAEHQRGTGYPAVSDGDVLDALIPLPPMEEQRSVSRALDRVDRKLQAERNRKYVVDRLFKTLLHELMSGTRRVKDLAEVI